MFKKQIRVFNNIFWNVFKKTPNQIFIESILFSVPLEFYTDDVYETTLGIINYLKNSTMQNIKSICDDNVKLFAEPLNTFSFEIAYKFIRSLEID